MKLYDVKENFLFGRSRKMSKIPPLFWLKYTWTFPTYVQQSCNRKSNNWEKKGNREKIAMNWVAARVSGISTRIECC